MTQQYRERVNLKKVKEDHTNNPYFLWCHDVWSMFARCKIVFLQMNCSEFHQWLIHFNNHHGGVYWSYSLIPDPPNVLDFQKLWVGSVVVAEGVPPPQKKSHFEGVYDFCGQKSRRVERWVFQVTDPRQSNCGVILDVRFLDQDIKGRGQEKCQDQLKK